MAQPSLDSFVGTQGNQQPSLDSFSQGAQGDTQPQQPQQTQPQGDFLDKASNIVGSIFPGKQIGQAIGTLGGYGATALGEKLGMMPKGSTGAYDLSAPSPLQVAGDAAQGVLTAAAPEVGAGESALGRIGANAALGAGLGGSGAVAEGKNIWETAKSAALGGAVGGGLSGAGEIGKYLTENMPNWFTKLALPKLSNSKVSGAPADVVNYALNNTKGATLNSMYNTSNGALKSYEDQVQAVLSHPQYANETGSKTVLSDVANKFQNAQLTPDAITKYAKSIAPSEKALVDKVANGSANLQEQNQLRKVLDQATKKRFTDSPGLSFAKQVGGGLADSLRTNVQSTAKETAPIFADYSKEHALNRALGNALSKKRVAGPLIAGTAGGASGFATGGITGALKGGLGVVAVEEGLRSPTAKLLAGKAIQGVGKVAIPAASAAFQAGKAPLIRSLRNQNTNQ